MSDEIASVEHEGFTILSNSETPEGIRESLSRDKPAAKDLKADTETLDASGKKHAGDGKFKGKVAPIKDAKVEAKPAGTKESSEEPEIEKKPEKAASDRRPEKADDKPDADEIAQAKADESEKETQRRSQAADRVKQATQRAAEERRQREALAQENAQLRSMLERGGDNAAKPQPSVQREDGRDPRATAPPDPNQYQTMAEYLDARDAHNRQTWSREVEDQRRAYVQEQRERQQQEYISKAVAEAEKALSEPGALDGVSEDLLSLEPSFMAKARGVSPGPWHALADEIIKAGKQGPAMLRYLSDHPDELQHLDRLNPLQFQRKMGEITGKLQAVTAAKPATKGDTFTPEPFKPVRAVTGQAQHVENDADEMAMDFDQLAARRLRQGKLLPLRR